ncbi:MAG TPA: c-type cytochrome [Gammaproteobacteria bacterium]
MRTLTLKSITANATLLAIVILVLGLITGCGNDKQTPPPVAESKIPAAEPQPAPAEPVPASSPPAQQPESVAEQPATAAVAATSEPPATPPAEPATPQAQPAAQPASASAGETASAGSAAAQAESLALARKSGCLACHAMDKKVVGPAWQDVAKRYANNPGARAQLIDKVAKGGKGNWTDVVGTAIMPPYHPRASMDDIGKLVDFVLSLANK